MDIYETRYYNINRAYLSLVGLWPHLDAKTKRIRSIFTFVIFGIITAVQFLRTFTAYTNMNLLVEILTNLIMSSCILTIYAVMYAEQKRITKLFDHIRTDWTKIQSKKECEIFEKYAKESRIFTLLLLLIFYGSIYSVFAFMLYPVVLDIIVPLNESRHYEILFPVEMFFDTSKYFHFSFPIVFFCLHIMANASIATFPMILLFVQHGNGLFYLVGYIFENLIDGEKEGHRNDNEERNVYERLKRGVRLHERSIKYMATVNSLCQSCFLIEVILVGIAIGVDILRVLQTPFATENVKEILTCIIHINGNIIWVVFNCYFGQKVIDHSSDIHTKICNSKWYMSSTKAQKLILMILVRSMKPVHISVGKVFIASLEFALSIVQTSVSYAMVFYSLR